MIRPCGPDPLTLEISTPSFAAILRASGLANTRSPLATGAACTGVSDEDAEAVGAAGSEVSDTALAGADTSPISDASSPSSNRMAIGVFTSTLSVPAAIRILPIIPSSMASTSIVALSVSISAKTSPEDTLSPSLTCHVASLPSVIVGDKAGMVIVIGILYPPLIYGMSLYSQHR